MLAVYATALSGVVRPVLPTPAESSVPFLSDVAIHVPEYADAQWHLAATAHAAAHLAFPRAPMPRAGRKAITCALINALEDARVEGLLLRRLPGLRRVWQPFFAGSITGVAFPDLLLRLSRVLFDPAADDPHPWVIKGRRLYAAAGAEDVVPEDLTRIAGLLGNDLGQLRLPFNDRDHVLAPDYRDDQRWLWSGGAEPAAAQETPQPDTAAGAPPPEATATSTAALPEWDHRIRRLRHGWCTVAELVPTSTATPADPPTQSTVARLTRALRQRPARARQRRAGEREGDEFDPAGLVDVGVARRQGRAGDERIHLREWRCRQPLAVLVLIDASASTAQPHASGAGSVLAVARQAAAALATVCQRAAVPCAIHAFRSRGRRAVEYLRVLDAGASWEATAAARLAALESGDSTRLGAALRYATRRWRTRREPERLILLLSDGRPHDVDVHDPHYLVADAQRAVDEARQAGVTVCALGLTPESAPALRLMLGPGAWELLAAAVAPSVALPAALGRILARA